MGLVTGEMPPAPRPHPALSHPYAHGHVRGKVHGDDDDVGQAQLRAGGLGVAGGVVRRHPEAVPSLSQREPGPNRDK